MCRNVFVIGRAGAILCVRRPHLRMREYASIYALPEILVGECSALWASGSDPADTSKDVSMHTAHAGERATVYRDKR